MLAPTATATAGLVRAVFSRPQLANLVDNPHVWLDAEAQADLGELHVVGLSVWGTPEALAFMADNVDDYLLENQAGGCGLVLRGSRLDSFVAIAKRLRKATA